MTSNNTDLSMDVRKGMTFLAGFVSLLLVPVLVYAGINFGHVDAVEEQVEELDKKILEEEGGPGGGCSVQYGNWLSTMNSMEDLDKELLETNVGTSAELDVIGNTSFGEDDPDGTDLRPDTMVQRCNTRFGDVGDTDYEHHIFCRGFRLPDGKKYDNFSELQADVNSGPMDLNTLSFFHAGNIDDDSEEWLIPFLDRYRSGCQSRTTHVIVFGAYVEKSGSRRISDGNKWHLTSTKWAGTILEDVMDQSDLVVTGHSTASCPFDGTDTRGLYVGGQAESEGRRMTNRIGSNALWVGTGADTEDQNECFSGTANDNPANASGGGIQLEYQVTTPTPVPPEDIAEAVLREY